MMTNIVVCFATLLAGTATAPSGMSLIRSTPGAQEDGRDVRRFNLRNIGSEPAFRTLSWAGQSPDYPSIDILTYDPSSNSIIARGNRQDLDKLAELLKQMDLPEIKVYVDVKVELRERGIQQDMTLRVNNGSTVSLDDKPNGLLLALELRVEDKDKSEIKAKLTWMEGKEKRSVTSIITRKDPRAVVDFSDQAKDKDRAPRVIVDFKNLLFKA